MEVSEAGTGEVAAPTVGEAGADTVLPVATLGGSSRKSRSTASPGNLISACSSTEVADEPEVEAASSRALPSTEHAPKDGAGEMANRCLSSRDCCWTWCCWLLVACGWGWIWA